VPFDDLVVLYARSPKKDEELVVQIRHAGHILEKITFEGGTWEQKTLKRPCTAALIRSENTPAITDGSILTTGVASETIEGPSV
jgi:hypothetical protein